MKKKQDEGKNQFRCMICQAIRLRGVITPVVKGEFKGYAVKTCQKPLCMKLAGEGIFHIFK